MEGREEGRRGGDGPVGVDRAGGNDCGGGGGRIEGGYDVVLDCIDNPATRYLVHDVCVCGLEEGLGYCGGAEGGGPVDEAELSACTGSYSFAVSSPDSEWRGGGGDGAAAAGGRRREKGLRYRCIFPVLPPPETVRSYSGTGIVGPVGGVIGTLMAMEVFKVISATAHRTAKGKEGDGEDGQRSSLLLYNAFSIDPKAVSRSVWPRQGARRDCLACREVEGGDLGRKTTMEQIGRGEADYGMFFGRVEDLRLLDRERRLAPGYLPRG